MNLSHYKNKVAIVTGGANGIGRCITRHLIDVGAHVIIIDTDKDAGATLKKNFGDNIFFFTGDIGKQTNLDRFISIVLEKYPRIDFLINNAMISRGGIIDKCNFDDFTYTLQVGITAPYYLTMKLVDSFAPNATVVNISSSRSAQSQKNTESYSAAKGGIAALTHALSVSLAGIARVNAIAPGWIDTSGWQSNEIDVNYNEAGMSSLSDSCIQCHSQADRRQHSSGRVGKPEDIAKLVLFLCGDDAGFINGQEIFVDGGMSKLMIYHDDHGWTYQPKE